MKKKPLVSKRVNHNMKMAIMKKQLMTFTTFLNKYPNGSNALLAHYHRGESYSVLKKYSEALIDYDYIVQKGQSKYYAKALRKAALIAYNHEQDFNKAFSYYTLLEPAATDDDTRFEAQVRSNA